MYFIKAYNNNNKGKSEICMHSISGTRRYIGMQLGQKQRAGNPCGCGPLPADFRVRLRVFLAQRSLLKACSRHGP